MKKAWLDGFNAAKEVLLQMESLKKDQRLTVSYRQNNENKKIPIQLSEYKNWKFRVALDDNSITPWNYFDREPKGEDYIKVKEYYTRLKEKGEDYTITPKKIINSMIIKKKYGTIIFLLFVLFFQKKTLMIKTKFLKLLKWLLPVR